MYLKHPIKALGLSGLAAVVAVVVMAVGASAASAHSFFASKVPGTAKSINHNSKGEVSPQEFTVSFGKVICKKAEGEGKIEKSPSETQKVSVKYSECEEENFLEGKGSATVEGAEYEFNANGSVKVTKPITIKAAFCTITVPTEEGGKAVNNELKTVEYKTIAGPPKKIEENTKVTGIHYQSFCGSGTAGTETGTNIVEEVGGEAWYE